jgi:hypothetical protein
MENYILITRAKVWYKRLNKNKKNALVVASDNYFIRLMKSKLRIFLKFGNTNVVLREVIKRQKRWKTIPSKNMFVELKRDINEVKNTID